MKKLILAMIMILSNAGCHFDCLALLVNNTAEISVAPKNKKAHRQKNNRVSTPAKTNSKSDTKKDVSIVSGPRSFNGQLMYRELSYMNNLIKNLSFGMGFNGEKSVKIIVKGDKVHIYDLTMHDHLIINGDNSGYLYNDVSKAGLIIDGKFLTYYKDAFNLEERKKIMEEKMRKSKPDATVEISSDVAVRDRKVMYKGDECKVKSGEIKMDQSITDVEAWYSENYFPIQNLKYYFMGLDTPGILRKALVTSQVPVPLFGTGKTANAYELVAVSEFTPDDSDFSVPADIKLEKFKDNGQYVKYLKNASKSLKKAKLYPKSEKKKDVKFAIENNWDFVNEWLDKKIEFDDRGVTWAKVGEALLTGVGAVVDLTRVVAGKDAIFTDNGGKQGLISQAKAAYEQGRAAKQNTSVGGIDENVADYEINSLISQIADESYTLSKKMKKKEAAPYIEANDATVVWLRDKQRKGQSKISASEWNEYRAAIKLEPVAGFSGGCPMYGNDILSSPTAPVYKSPMDKGGDMYIPHHVQHNNNKIAELKGYIDQLDKTGTFNARSPQYLSNMEIMPIDFVCPKSFNDPKRLEMERRSARKLLNDKILRLQEDNNKMLTYASSANSQYYPESMVRNEIEYNNAEIANEKNYKEEVKKIDEHQRETNRAFFNSRIYDDYVRMLEHHYTIAEIDNEGFDWKWIREIQATMRELREEGKFEKYNIHRSKWEDWSPDYDPYKN